MIIYKITNNINGAIYIGQTVQDLKNRWRDHKKPSNKGCPILSKAISKYGAGNFSIEQIDTASSQEDLDKKEIYWISFFKSSEGRNYNYTSGGRGCSHPHTDETKRKLSEYFTGQNNPNWGKPKSDEWKAHMSSLMKGRPVLPETRAKISKTLTGRKNGPRSEETKKKLSESQKGKPRTQRIFTRPVICLNTGVRYISAAEAARQLGFSNSQRCKISLVCLGKRKSVAGMIFTYAGDRDI
jgi:group I intron endonuclease